MAPNLTPEKRAKLRTVDEINNEMRRNYRLSVNKKITLTEARNRNASLALLRNGMSDPLEKPESSYNPPEIRVFSVPSGFFLSEAQIAASKRNVALVNIDDCTPFTDFAAPSENVVVPLRRQLAGPADPRMPTEAELEARLKAMPRERMEEIARLLGLPVDDEPGKQAEQGDEEEQLLDAVEALARQVDRLVDK